MYRLLDQYQQSFHCVVICVTTSYRLSAVHIVFLFFPIESDDDDGGDDIRHFLTYGSELNRFRFFFGLLRLLKAHYYQVRNHNLAKYPLHRFGIIGDGKTTDSWYNIMIIADISTVVDVVVVVVMVVRHIQSVFFRRHHSQ